MQSRLALVVVMALLGGCAAAPPTRERPRSHASAGSARAAVVAGGTCDPGPVTAEPAPASRLDTDLLARRFEEAGYAIPEGAHLLVGRELDASPTRFSWLSYGDTGIAPSEGRYWPASTVKLMAAVAALETLHDAGLTGAAELSFVDDDGAHRGTARELARIAVEVSDNPAYNRLVLVAGFDAINDRILPSWGLRHTFLQRRFTRPPGVPDLALRRSPEIRWREGDRTGALPERTGTGHHAECPADGNCTTLYELLDVMRRVTLHDELPPDERFRLHDDDVRTLHEALLRSRSRLELGATAALEDVLVYNKTGTVPGDERLDHGLVVDRRTGRRYLLALALPWATTTNDDAEELARQALEVAAQLPL